MTSSPPLLQSFPGYPPGVQVPMMTPSGLGTSGIVAFGESLGENEEKEGRPFVEWAEAGSVLERALWRAGIPRSHLTLTNIVWYRPPRNWLDGAPWEADAIRACRPLNDELVDRVRPKVILALGGLAMRELTGFCGEKQGIEMVRGFIVPGLLYQGIPVIGTYHPSFLRRGSKERQKSGPRGKVESAGGGTMGMNLLGVIIRDLQLARDVAARGANPFSHHPYILDASLEDWRRASEFVLANPAEAVSYDFETQDSLVAPDESEMAVIKREVTQVQIAVGSLVLVSPWRPELLPYLKAIVESPSTKIDWNGRKFDRPILRQMSIRTDLGRWVDAMDMWHHAQPDLPRGLQFASSFFCPEAGPWKHLSTSDPLYYGAMDVDMPLRIVSALDLSLSVTRSPISGVTLRQGFEDQVVRLSPVLDRMSARGIPVDESARQALDAEFGQVIRGLEEKVQGLVPDNLKNVSPKNGFVRDPKFTDGMTKGYVRREFTAQVPCMGASGSKCVWARRTRKSAKSSKPDPLDASLNTGCPRCFNTGKVTETVERWARLEPFLPGSWQQMARYIRFRRDEEADSIPESKRRWYMPVSHKTGQDTTEEPELRRLQSKVQDPVLAIRLEFQEVSKLRGTYVRGWAPGLDGRVHPNFGFKPATLQLSSDSPNAQNFPKHGELAHKMKAMIIATPGRKMVSFDWKSCHIITLGFEAQDADYIRIGRIDMHSFFALVGMLRLERADRVLSLSDLEIRDLLCWWKKSERTFPDYAGRTFQRIRDEIAKHAILAYGNGQQPRGLFLRNPQAFPTEKDAIRCQDMLDGLYPKLQKFKSRITLEADTRAALVSRFGSIRRFFDVFHRRPVADNYQPRFGQRVWVNKTTGQKWALTPGDDHEAAIAFHIQADALGIKRETMVRLGEAGLDEEYGLIDEIHDDLRFECEVGKLDRMIPDVKARMESPSPKLIDPEVAPGGLWVGVDVAVGNSWADLEKISL